MFTTTDLSNMRSAHIDRLQDTCYLQARTVTPDSMNQQVESWADTGSALSCGLEMKAGSETQLLEKTLVVYDAILRLAIADVPTEVQRVRVTKRYGETLTTAMIFDIASPIQRGPSGIRILLTKVTT